MWSYLSIASRSIHRARLFGANLISVPARISAMTSGDAQVSHADPVMFVANPNNPTGTLAAREDMARLLNDVPPNVLLVMDEAYSELRRMRSICFRSSAAARRISS
jgi:histidinol-phosphate/aromatic aminotransferase/cobyric acid decarboxylase-like protein